MPFPSFQYANLMFGSTKTADNIKNLFTPNYFVYGDKYIVV